MRGFGDTDPNPLNLNEARQGNRDRRCSSINRAMQLAIESGTFVTSDQRYVWGVVASNRSSSRPGNATKSAVGAAGGDQRGWIRRVADAIVQSASKNKDIAALVVFCGTLALLLYLKAPAYYLPYLCLLAVIYYFYRLIELIVPKILKERANAAKYARERQAIVEAAQIKQDELSARIPSTVTGQEPLDKVKPKKRR